jgi:cation diffusion facilitator CzcD-associated flavoprotein CzcO
MPRVAIVGGGLCGFVAYLTLRRAGVADVTVFSPEADPAATFRVRAAAIRQSHMRSESDGHCLPTSFPGLAVRDARLRRSVAPLVASVLDRYHASVETFLAHVDDERRRSGWSPVPQRVEAIRAVDGGFELDGHGVFEHVLIATGHPGLAVPEELRDDPRVVHAYEPHEYAPSVCVVGAGLAAATEWRNASAAGARVTSVRRREPVQRPLNVPRPLLSKRGSTGSTARRGPPSFMNYWLPRIRARPTSTSRSSGTSTAPTRSSRRPVSCAASATTRSLRHSSTKTNCRR